MSIIYGTPGRVNFGWITESWQLFTAQAGIWIVATLILMAVPMALSGVFMGWMMITLGPTMTPRTLPSQTLPPPTLGHGVRNIFFPQSLPSQFVPIIGGEIALGLVVLIYSSYLYGALFRMAVQQVRGLPISYRDIFSGWPLFGRMLGAMLLLGLGSYGLEMVIESPVFLLIWLRPHSIVALVVASIFAGLLLMCLFLILAALLLPMFSLMADGEGVFPSLRRSVRAMKGQWLSATGFVVVLILLVYASEIPCGLGLLATLPMVFLISALAYRDMVGMPNMVPPPTPPARQDTPGVWPPPPQSGPAPPAGAI